MRTRAPPVRPVVLAPREAGACAGCEVRERSVCSAVPDDVLARLAAVASAVHYPKGATFIAEGTPASAFFNVTHGTAKLFKLLPDGRQQITGFASAGHFLGLAATDRYGFGAEAIEPMCLCRFERAKLAGLLRELPDLERRLLETACNELATAQEHMVLLGRKTAAERVASFLLNWTRCAPDGDVHLPMTRGEIADHLGLTIETVSRTFTQFRAGRRVATPSTDSVRVLDRPWLEDLALAAG